MWVNLIAYLAAAALLVPVAVVCLECLAALLPHRRRDAAVGARPALAVLVPAHDEESGIAATLHSIRPQLLPGDRLVVVADNCSDATAAIARAAGADVVERNEPDRRGKGYALAAGLRALESSPPALVVMVDADCRLAHGAIDALSAQVHRSARPAQAVYLLHSDSAPAGRQAVSMLAFLVKNYVRPLGLRQLGLPCLLTGTGMAISWDALRLVPLASGNIVEDMQLGLDLAVAGHAPLLCPEAQVSGVMPAGSAARTQRRRWEHGHLRTLLAQVPRLFIESFRQRRGELAALALELGVPPLSLLIMLMLLAIALILAARPLGATLGPVWVLLVGMFACLLCLLAAWARFGRQIPLRYLLAAPFYAVSKLMLYLSFLLRPQTRWVRTERPHEKDPANTIAP